MAAMVTVNINLPEAVMEAARRLEDLGLGFTLAALLPASRTANDAAMRTILEALTPAQRADLSCLGASLVELINEIGEKQWEAERAAREEPGPECYDCETSGVNCLAHRAAEERRRAGW